LGGKTGTVIDGGGKLPFWAEESGWVGAEEEDIVKGES
jgi:hypothetical protein